MKLQELTEDYGTLPEPIKAPTLSNHIGVFDNIDVWEDNTSSIFTVLGFKENENTIAYIAYENNLIQNAHPLRYLWVDKSQRGKGLGTKLLLVVLRQLGEKLILTQKEIVTDGARAVILKSVQADKIKVLCKDKQLSHEELRKIFNILGETKTELILTI